jgi:hypothetical protein
MVVLSTVANFVRQGSIIGLVPEILIYSFIFPALRLVLTNHYLCIIFSCTSGPSKAGGSATAPNSQSRNEVFTVKNPAFRNPITCRQLIGNRHNIGSSSSSTLM